MYLKFRLLKVSFKTGKCLFVIPKWHFFHFFLGGGVIERFQRFFFEIKDVIEILLGNTTSGI